MASKVCWVAYGSLPLPQIYALSYIAKGFSRSEEIKMGAGEIAQPLKPRFAMKKD